MRRSHAFTSELLATEPAATSLSQPGLNIIPSEVLKMLQSWMSRNGAAPLFASSSLMRLELASGMAFFSREPSEGWKGYCWWNPGSFQQLKKEAQGESTWLIFVPMNKLPWISCYSNPSLLAEFSLWHHIDFILGRIRRNQCGWLFYIQLYLNNRNQKLNQLLLSIVHIKMIDFQVAKFSGKWTRIQLS